MLSTNGKNWRCNNCITRYDTCILILYRDNTCSTSHLVKVVLDDLISKVFVVITCLV